jgi:hypothetical protein
MRIISVKTPIHLLRQKRQNYLQITNIDPQVYKLRTGSSSVDKLSSALLQPTDPALLVYPAWQLFRELNDTAQLRATLPVVTNVTSRHMSYGQESILRISHLGRKLFEQFFCTKFWTF